MNICLITGSFPPTRCGVGDYTARLASALAKEKHHVVVITSAGQTTADFMSMTVKPVMKHWGLAGIRPLLTMVQQIRPDVVHLQYPSSGYGKALGINMLFWLLKITLPRVQRVLTLHEYEVFSWKGRLRLWLSLKNAHRVICTNDRDAGLLKKRMPHLKLRVIPIGSNVGEKSGPQEPEPSVGRTIELLHFGTVMPNKGWPMMIAALEILAARGYRASLTVMSGLDGKRYLYHQEVESMIERSSVAAWIRFTGYLDEAALAALAGQDDIVVLPFSDGLRLNRGSFVAMLAYHKAIITTTAPFAIAEFEGTPPCALVPPGDAEALAEAIVQLWQHPDKRRQLRAAALAAARAFSWPAIAGKTLGVYDMV